MRNRTGAQRPRSNGDENAISKHTRQPSGIAIAGSRLAGGIAKSGPQRPALGEVTTLAVNRNKVCYICPRSRTVALTPDLCHRIPAANQMEKRRTTQKQA